MESRFTFMNSRSRALAFLAFLLAGAACLAAPSQSSDDLAVGKVLVAARDLPDPVFAKSVILLVHYDKTGGLGLMVNHRTRLPISQALSQLKDAAGHSDPVFAGGPVEMNTVFALLRAPAKPDGAVTVLEHTYFISTKTTLAKALQKSSNSSDLRIYLGYCGWAPQQLETEVSEGRWYIFDGSEALAFDAKPETLWTRLIAKTEGLLAQLTLASPGR
jgi:putative transcriptional regulator